MTLASWFKCPLQHQRELFPPECSTVRSDPLMHDDIRSCIAERFRPLRCVFQKERLLNAGDKVRPWKWARHNRWWPVAGARRSAEDCAVNPWMTKPKSEGQLSASRDAHNGGTFHGQRYAKPRLRPTANILDEEHLMCCEPDRVKDRRILMKTQCLIGQPMDTDDHCGRYRGVIAQAAPLCDLLTVTGKDDRFGRPGWNIHGDLPSTIVL